MRKPNYIQRHLLVHELRLITDDMATAMWKAHVPYVATGRPTINMLDVLARFYDWAQRANDAGVR